MSSPQIRAVIWDMGGVLLRTSDVEPRARLAERFGYNRLQLEDIVFTGETAHQAEIGAIPVAMHWQVVGKRLGLTDAELGTFSSDFFQTDRVDYSLVDLIRSLRPRYKTGLLSNAWDGARQALTERFSIIDVFDVVVFSYEVGLSKPDPQIFQLVLRRLGVSAQEAVFIDDFPRNITAAQDSGLQAIRFVNPDQAKTDLMELLQQAND
jgi:glucose-1-phosphatase